MRGAERALLLVVLAACSRSESPPPRAHASRTATAPASPSNIAGFRLGESPEEFRHACAAAGLSVDVIDPREPAWVHDDVARGARAQCSGAPAPLEYATVVQSNGAFHEGRLTFITFYAEETQAVVRDRVAERHPDAPHMLLAGRDLWVVDRAAARDGLMSMSVGPPYPAVGGSATVSYASKDGVDHPPPEHP